MGLPLCAWCDHTASTIGTIVKGSTVTATVGIAFRKDVHIASEPTSINGLPPGLSACWCGVAGNGNNYVSVYGTPTATGVYNPYIGSNTDNIVLRFTVADQPRPIPTNTPPDARKGDLYSHTVSIGPSNSAAITNPITTITGLAAGLSAAGAVISGVPTFHTIGGTDIGINIHISCDGNAAGTNTAQSIHILEAAPFIIANDSVTGYIGAPFSFTIQAPDIDVNAPVGQRAASKATSISISPSLPAGLTLNAVDSNGTATITGTPTATICSRPSNFYTILASNSTGGNSTKALQITISDDRQPVIPDVDLGKIYIDEVSPNFSIPATIGCPSTFSATNLPTGMSLTGVDNGSNTTGILSGTPTGTPGIWDESGLVGPFYHGPIVVSGTNVFAKTGSGLVSLIVGFRQSVFTNPDPNDPCTTLVEWVNSTAGFSFDCEATNNPQTFTADAFVVPAAPAVPGSGTSTTGLPTGLSINASTGLISGTPSVSALLLPMISTVTLTVTNAGAFGPVPADPANSATLQIRLVATAAEITPVITSDLDPRMPAPNDVASGIRGTAMTYQITATHCPTSFSASGLPPGLAVNTSTGLIFGTPTTVGFFHSTVQATNVWGTGSDTVNFIISYPAPVITSPLYTWGVTGEEFDPPVVYGGGSPAGYHITASVADPSDIPSGGLIFFATDFLVGGLEVDSVTGIIDSASAPGGVVDPTLTPGSYSVNIFATNPEAHFDVSEGEFVPALPAPVSDLIIRFYSPPPNPVSATPDSTTTTGGQVMTITGTNFLSGATVCFGKIDFTCVSVLTVTATQITVLIPALTLTDDAYDIVVKNPDGQTGIIVDGLVVLPVGSTSVPVARYTSLYSDDTPIYDITITAGKSNRKKRIFGLGTNVEVVFYSGRDTSNNLLLNVHRKQLGTNSTRHSTGDLVFKGIASIQLSPYLYKAATSRKIAHIDCVLRSNGRVDMKTREISGTGLVDDTDVAYAGYKAMLIKSLDLLPFLKIGTEECQEP